MEMEEENALEVVQRYRRDRQILLDFILSGSLIKKVIMPPGAVTLDDVDLDQVRGMLELSEAIRDYHDRTELPQMNNTGSVADFFLVTNPETSGSPPKRASPPMTDFKQLPVVSPPVDLLPPDPEFIESPVVSSVSKSESFNSAKVHELTVDDIEDFEDDDIVEEVASLRNSRRNRNDAIDLAPGLPSFVTDSRVD